MKILIDIPKAFEVDYNTDRFAEFFQRCLADMNTCCGNYEQETAEMMEKAFEKSRLYDPDKVVEQLEERTAFLKDCTRRSAFGFEIDRNFYQRAKNEMIVFERDNQISFEDIPGVMP